jgi:hypothetical protein
VHSYVQIIASVEAGGRSTLQHSQSGRSSSTSQVYLMMTVGTHQPPCHHSSVPRRSHGRALSAGAADVRRPMRGLNLLLRVLGTDLADCVRWHAPMHFSRSLLLG